MERIALISDVHGNLTALEAVLGNWDDFLPDPDRDFDSEALQWWLAQLGPGQGE